MTTAAGGAWPRTDGQRILFTFAAMVLLAALALGGMRLTRPVVGEAASTFGTMAMVIVATFVLLRVGGASLASLGLRRARLLREIGLGLAGVALLSALLLGAIAALEGWAAASSTWATVMGYGMGDRAFYFGIGVVAALTEEPLFRGYLQPALMGKLGAIGGLAITALVFAAVHPVVYAWPLTPLIGKLIHGLTLGLMRGRDRSLVGPMVTHASLWAIWGGA